MSAFLAEYGIEVVLSLTTAGLMAFCRFIWKQLQQYQKLLEEREDHAIESEIEKKIEPIYQELEDIRKFIRQTEEKKDSQLALLISSYKFRLIQLCRTYLSHQHMTQDEYDQLTEFYKLYQGLGGNGQAKEYYEKTILLPIIPDSEK